MFFSINCFVNENYVITIELILAEDENMTFYIVLCIPLLELLLILILIIAKIVNTYIVFALSLKISLSRIQEINSAYEGMKNENNKSRQQIFENQKTANQQQRNQSHMNDELKRRYIKLTHIF
jgi:hypothetical protein